MSFRVAAPLALALVTAGANAQADGTDPLQGWNRSACGSDDVASGASIIEHWRTTTGLGEFLLASPGPSESNLLQAIEHCADDPDCRLLSRDYGLDRGQRLRLYPRLALIKSYARALFASPLEASAAGALERADGGRVDPEGWRAVFEGPQEFQLNCRSTRERLPIRLGRSAADLSANTREKRRFATVSVEDNIKSDEQTYAIAAALGYDISLRSRGPNQRRMLRPYVSLARDGGDGDPSEQENIALLGVQYSVLRWNSNTERGFSHFTLDGAYVTDDSFDASGFRADVSYVPAWEHLRGFGRFQGFETEYGYSDVRLFWEVRGALDAWAVDDAGDALAEGVRSYARFGADFTVILRLDWEIPFVPQIRGEYGIREAFDGGESSADRGLLAVEFVPAENSPVSLGFVYETGDNLESLKFSQEFKVELGFRY